MWKAAPTSSATSFDELTPPWFGNVVAAGGAAAGTGTGIGTGAGSSASAGSGTGAGTAVGTAVAGAVAGDGTAGAAAASTAATAAAVSVAISGGPRLPSWTESICSENVNEEREMPTNRGGYRGRPRPVVGGRRGVVGVGRR